jgi:uncharacterized protein YdeI (YjbR/CyaY-like superfamily)
MPTLPENALEVPSRAAWRAWLRVNHARPTGLWVVTWKKASGGSHVSYAELVEEALCFGWVDSKPRALDAKRSMLWLAPRKKGSAWSKLNKTRVATLTAAGLMHAAGLARVAAAKKDGSWALLDAVEALRVPEDLAAALAAHGEAARHFDAFPRSVKRSILEWVAQAKTPPTRLKRITETATLAAKNVRAHQWRP